MRYANIKPADIVITGGRGAVANVVRFGTAGVSNMFDKEISTHVGVVIEIHGQLFIAEMKGGKGLQINSFKTYTQARRRWIIDVVRPPEMTEAKREMIQMRIAKDYRYMLEYDTLGALSFALPVEECSEKEYCSEYVVTLFTHARIYFNLKHPVSPWDLQKLNLPTVNWRT